MKEKITLNVKTPKRRGHIAPAPRAHKDKVKDYSRKQFNNSKNWQ